MRTCLRIIVYEGTRGYLTHGHYWTVDWTQLVYSAEVVRRHLDRTCSMSTALSKSLSNLSVHSWRRDSKCEIGKCELDRSRIVVLGKLCLIYLVGKLRYRN